MKLCELWKAVACNAAAFAFGYGLSYLQGVELPERLTMGVGTSVGMLWWAHFSSIAKCRDTNDSQKG